MKLLTRYDPFAEFGTLNHWMEDELYRFFPARGEGENKHWRPAVDIAENESEYLIKAELPEVDEKAIDMTIENHLLTLKGERKMEEEENKDNYTRVERHYGTFERTFRLPESVDEKKITAKMKEGVLKIVLPKKEETKPRSIKVETK